MSILAHHRQCLCILLADDYRTSREVKIFQTRIKSKHLRSANGHCRREYALA